MLGLERNRLNDTPTLTSLSPTLRKLYLSHNTFEGSLDLTGLPENLESLQVSDNSLSGEIDISQLPVGLELLDVRNNTLCGTVQPPPGVFCWDNGRASDSSFDGNKDLTVERL